jgi:hypothetical protein
MPVQADDPRPGVVAPRDGGKSTDEWIDANVSASRDISSSAAQSGLAASTGLVERDSTPRSVRSDAHDALECPSGGRPRNEDQSDSHEQRDQETPCHLSNDTAVVTLGVPGARRVASAVAVTPNDQERAVPRSGAGVLAGIRRRRGRLLRKRDVDRIL